MTTLFWISVAVALVLSLLALFWQRLLPAPAPLPEPGEIWDFEPFPNRIREGSPWEEVEGREPVTATIVDVQDGWVRYRFFEHSSPGRDHARPLKEFIGMYRRWPNP